MQDTQKGQSLEHQVQGLVSDDLRNMQTEKEKLHTMYNSSKLAHRVLECCNPGCALAPPGDLIMYCEA